MRQACFLLFVFISSFAFADSKVPDACTLITAQDVQSVVGSGFQLSPFHGMSSDYSNCGYTRGSTDKVNLTVLPASGGAATTLAGLMKQQGATGFKVTPVTELGEGAYLGEKSIGGLTLKNVATLHFGKGQLHVLLDVQISGKPNVELEEKLGKLIYAKMQ